jgi:hypothetical protein
LFDVANQISTFIAPALSIVVTPPTLLMNRKRPARRFLSQNKSKINSLSVDVHI